MRKWVFGLYTLVTNLKSVSSMKLHRDLGVCQKTAWFMSQRIRQAWASGAWMPSGDKFAGPVEVDKTYVGGLERNKHKSKKLHAGGRTVGKTAVVGAKDRRTGKVQARVIKSVDMLHLSAFVSKHVRPGKTVYTDENPSHGAIEGRYRHEAVNHSTGDYVRHDSCKRH